MFKLAAVLLLSCLPLVSAEFTTESFDRFQISYDRTNRSAAYELVVNLLRQAVRIGEFDGTVGQNLLVLQGLPEMDLSEYEPPAGPDEWGGSKGDIVELITIVLQTPFGQQYYTLHVTHDRSPSIGSVQDILRHLLRTQRSALRAFLYI